MKYKINAIILLLILTTSLFSASKLKLTQEERDFLRDNAPLRLHNELNWPPYNYYENNAPKGFSIDYMNLLAKKLNVPVKYITGPSWDEFMQMLQDDKIDAIINISKNEQRAKTIAFTSIFHIAANAIYVKIGNESIDSLEKLKGKTIVMPKGFFAQKAIEKYYPEIKQILVKDSLAALKLLSLGKADATIGKKNVIDYIIALNNVSGVTPTNYVDDNRMVSLIRIGTSKKNSKLRDILEKAQKSVTDQEILQLKRKWFGTKDIQEKISNSFLTKYEKDYIQTRRYFSVCNQIDLKPIEFEENGIFQGITIDLLDKISTFTGAKFVSVKTKSWEEAKEFLKQNKCDFISTVSNSAELVDIARSTKPYLNYKLAIITQKSKPVVSSLDEILDKTIAKKEDSNLISMLQATNPDLNVLYTKSNRESLEAVSLGKAYFALESLPIASYYMSNYALKNLYISRYTNMPYTINMAVSKDNEILLNILNKSLDMISQTDHREVFNKWTSSVSYEKVFDYEHFWEIFVALIILISIFAYRHYVLDKLNKNLKMANDEIANKTKQLAKQKVLFETLYNKSADGVILIRNNIFINCNESTLRILKYKEDEIINKCFLDISPLEQPNGKLSKEEARNHIKVALNKGVTSFEWVFEDRISNIIWVEIVLTAIEIEENKVLHAVIRDITNRKNLEHRLEDLNSNLEKRVQEEIKKNEINTQRLLQQSRLAQMGEMISMIAHQWRQPLSAISATTNNLIIKMMIEGKVNKELFDSELKLVSEYSQYLSSTIDDFRNFFKTDKEKKTFDLNLVIEKSLQIIKTSLKSNEIEAKTYLEPNIKINSYPSELQQVILNILKNSEDALLEKDIENKRITIQTFMKEDKATIKIDDNGGGIDESIINRIFDPYFSTKNKKDGTGLGLYMSKIIINDHCNGSLKVLNENKGATFLIELPIKS